MQEMKRYSEAFKLKVVTEIENGKIQCRRREWRAVGGRMKGGRRNQCFF
jgi:hypothetical protein